MKKLICVTFFLVLLITPTLRAEQHVVYLPQIFRSPNMGDWKIIVPTETINMPLNPSAEIAGNFASVAGSTVTRVTTSSWSGSYSFRVQTSGDNEAMSLTLSALTNAIHYVTVRVSGTLPAAWDWSLDNISYTEPTKLLDYDDTWSLYGLQFPAVQANGSTTLFINQKGAGAGDFNVDAIQVEAQTIWTTYCDGDQVGCEWNGAAHSSTSTRSALSRAGGFVKDLKQDFFFGIIDVIGTGMPPQSDNVDGFSILPGGQLNSIKVETRVFTLVGVFKDENGTVDCDINEMRQALLEELAHDKYPKTDLGWQPVILRYTRADVLKEIKVHYEAGLEANINFVERFTFERASIRFISPDPFWYALGEESTAFDTEDTITTRYTSGRLKSTGQWDDLGPPVAPTTFSNMGPIVIGTDKIVYWGGEFTNFDGDASADNITSYDPATDTWANVGIANARVRALAVDSQGRIYAGGDFTSIGGTAANRIAVLTPSTGVWAALGSGLNNDCWAIAIDQAGLVCAAGDFTTAGGGGANRIASWDGSAWSALGTGLSDTGQALVVGLDNTLYAGGEFATAGGTTVNLVGAWDGSAWSALGSGMSGGTADVFALVVDSRGELIAAGNFDTAGGESVNNVAQWNGTAWRALGTGVTGGSINTMAIGPDDIVYAGGAFTTAGGVALTNKSAGWNGSSWFELDIDVNVLAVLVDFVGFATGSADPVVASNYDLWASFQAATSSDIAGSTTITNSGTAPAWPSISVARSGGTNARLIRIRNETTGKTLWFNYSLLDGETLTIDLDPLVGSIESSFFGFREDAILANSDRGSFTVRVGSNQITAFVDESGGPTVTSFLVYKTPYKSFD